MADGGRGTERPRPAADRCHELAAGRLHRDDARSRRTPGDATSSSSSIPETGKPFVIKSLGADGQEGGEGYNADLLSTDAN